jgi:hypothetical protein
LLAERAGILADDGSGDTFEFDNWNAVACYALDPCRNIGRLAFMGGRDGVLILCPVGRGWLPTGRPAEVLPVDVTVAGGGEAEIALPGTPHQVRLVPR